MRFARVANALGDRYRHAIISLRGRFEAATLLDPGVNWRQIEVPAEHPFARLQRARRVLRQEAPGLMVTHNWGSTEWALANRWHPFCRHLHIEDGFGPEEVDRQLPRRIWFRRLALGGRHTQVVVPSHRLVQIATQEWRLPKAKVQLVPNGVDVARFANADRARAAAELGKRPGEQMVGTVARLRPEKNVGRLVEAFAELAARRPDCRLLIVGDGPQRADIEALARNRGAADRCLFVGASSEPERYLAAMDVFAVSSDTEQMPLGVLEAMAAALPVASVDVGDIAQMVVARNRPFVVPAGDTSALARAIETLLAAQDLARAIGGENLQRARSVYALETMISIYDGIFSQPPLR